MTIYKIIHVYYFKKKSYETRNIYMNLEVVFFFFFFFYIKTFKKILMRGRD